VSTLSNYDSQAEHVYVVMSEVDAWINRGTIRRISAKTGVMDPAWALVPRSLPGDYLVANTLVADSAGGLWRSDWNTIFMYTGYYARRYAIADAGTVEQPKIAEYGSVIVGLRAFAYSDDYTYIGLQRFKTGSGQLHPMWATKLDPNLVTSEYVFFATNTPGNPVLGFTRASARNQAGASSWSFMFPPGYSALGAKNALDHTGRPRQPRGTHAPDR
jgi:hypothetical protein